MSLLSWLFGSFRRDCPFPRVCNGLGNFVKNQLAACMWSNFWIIYSIPLVYVSALMPVQCCFNYYSFVECFEVRYYDAYSFIYYYHLLSGLLGYSWSFVVPYDFLCVHFCKEYH